MKRLLTLAILFTVACASAAAQTRGGGGGGQTRGAASAASAPAPAQDTLIRNATVLTVSRGTLAGTDVLIRNGKISAVGPNLKAPDGARVIDATGKFVLPGIIDAHSHSMMDGSVNECTRSVTSMTTTRDILNPTAVNIYRELAGGTTAALLLHGSCNSIGGSAHDRQVQVGPPGRGLPRPRRAARNQVRARREPEALELQRARARARATPPRAWASKRPSATPSRARATTSATGTTTAPPLRAARRT